jgi:pentatricopeptide repeat protein
MGIKSRNVKWLGHLSHVGEMRDAYKIFVSMKERNYLGDLCMNGRIILKWIQNIGCENMDWFHLVQVGSSGKLL